MKRTPYEGLIAVAGFFAAAAVIVVRRFYGLLESVDLVVPLLSLIHISEPTRRS